MYRWLVVMPVDVVILIVFTAVTVDLDRYTTPMFLAALIRFWMSVGYCILRLLFESHCRRSGWRGWRPGAWMLQCTSYTDTASRLCSCND